MKRLSVRLAALLMTIALPLLSALASSEIRPFSIRYQTNDRGEIVQIGNTLMSCATGTTNCAAARNGGPYNNNDFNMVYVDVDSDTSTFNSSESTLALPTGAQVLFAGLYWGASSSNANRNQVQFALPGTGYLSTTATRLDSSGSIYSAFANVTGLVQSLSNPNGVYRVANVQGTTGSNQHAGWSLVVVYRDLRTPEKLRNLTVFDGFDVINTTNPTSLTTTVSGFITPKFGTFSTRVGVVAYEGDINLLNDSMQLEGRALSDALNPQTNYFNSSITRLGVRFSSKNPDYVNQLAFDCDYVDASGILANGATSARVTFTTNGDVYYPSVMTFAVEVFSPQVSGNVIKTVTDLNGGQVQPGDTLEYTIAVANTGNDGATKMVLTDPIPANSSFVAGSLRVSSGANAGSKTDGAGDDQAEYDAATKRVVFRLGTDATATQGGALNPAATTAVVFRVRVNNGTPGGTIIANQATVNYVSATLGTSETVLSDGDTAQPGDQTTDVSVAGPSILGRVYQDSNHNAAFDGNEAGTALTLFAKLVPSSTPGGPAQRVVAVDPTTGQYQFSNLSAGSYNVLISQNSVPADLTVVIPSGWIGTEAPTLQRNGIAVSAIDVPNQNFGLFHGARIDGTVFDDSSGIANDGVRQPSESGIGDATVQLRHASCSAGLCDSTSPAADGSFSLFAPFSTQGLTASIVEINAGGYISTGAQIGTTAGSYDRVSDTLQFVVQSGTIYGGVAFGDVLDNELAPSNSGATTPGGVVFYRHRFAAGTKGTVTFSLSETDAPATPAWSATLALDNNCDGTGDASPAPALPLNAGQAICLVVKQAAPAAAPMGATGVATLTAAFDYVGATPPLNRSRSVTDSTSVALLDQELLLSKSVDKSSARPGERLTYTIEYRNLSADPIRSVVIRDATPAFTSFVSATCGTLGSGLTACSLTQAPAAGGTGPLVWTMTGALNSGGVGTVTMVVQVTP